MSCLRNLLSNMATAINTKSSKILWSNNICNLAEDINQRNFKHIKKHLSEFQKYDSNITLNDVIILGNNIAQNSDNFIGTSAESPLFEQNVMIGKQKVKVRVVLNPQGNLRSIHIRY